MTAADHVNPSEAFVMHLKIHYQTMPQHKHPSTLDSNLTILNENLSSLQYGILPWFEP